MSRETKTLAFKITTNGTTKSDDGQEFGHLVAYGAVFNNVDSGNDKILPQAFKRTIKNAKDRASARSKKYWVPMLWNHSPDDIIGGWFSLTEDDFGLKCEGDINLATQRGREYWELARSGMSDQFSIIYEVMPSGAKYNKDGIRELSELRLYSVDPVSLAMNDETLLVSVKSQDNLSHKSVIGTTSGPIGPRDESWDSSAAEKWIWDAAEKDDGSLNATLAKKYFMVQDGDAQKKGSYSYPFWYVGDSPHICVGAVTAIAAAIGGARGASAPDGLKSKVETLYKRINKKYPDDTQLTPSWDDGKARSRMNRKDFHDNYRPRQIRDWKSELYSLVSSFCETCDDAFKEGDEPLTDIMDALNGNDDSPGFIAEVQKWVEEGIGLDYSNYLTEMQSSSPPYSYYDYMSNQNEREEKAGRTVSASTAGTIQSHADNLHDLADKALSSMKEHTKAIRSVADDLATFVLQGSEPATTTDPGDAGDRQEGKATSHADVRRPHKEHPSQGTASTEKPSSQDTVPEQDLTTALEAIRQLRKTTTIVA